MVNSGKKFRALPDKKKILNETKKHNPSHPLQVKWSVPKIKQETQMVKLCDALELRRGKEGWDYRTKWGCLCSSSWTAPHVK